MLRSCSRATQSILYLKRTVTRERYGAMKSALSDSHPKVYLLLVESCESRLGTTADVQRVSISCCSQVRSHVCRSRAL